MQSSLSADFEVQVNGDVCTVPSGTRVRALLARLGLADRRVAVAINREIVRRDEYDRRELVAGDRIEVLEAVGGGK